MAWFGPNMSAFGSGLCSSRPRRSCNQPTPLQGKQESPKPEPIRRTAAGFQLFFEVSLRETTSALLVSGFRAVQSTTLIDRKTGKPLGIISTHWRKPHRPTDPELRL